MDWTQALTIIFSTVGFVLVLFIYLMSRMDNKFAHMDNKFTQLLNRMDSNHKELEQKMDSNQKELEQKMDSKFDAVNTRFNALENRLTAVEVEIKSTNQRLSNIESCVMPRKVFHFEEPEHKDEPKEN